MPDVFLSYGRDDRSQAERVASVLEQHGWSVWWDRKIHGGETFDHIIQQALAEARCVVVLWSASSIMSRWVKDEATEGARRDILIPVLIDAVDLPLGFRQFQAVSLTDAAGEADSSQFDDLIDAVEHMLGQATAAAAEPVVRSRRPSGATAPRRSAAISRSYFYGALMVSLIFVAGVFWLRGGSPRDADDGSQARGRRMMVGVSNPQTGESTRMSDAPSPPLAAVNPAGGEAAGRVVDGPPGVMVNGTGHDLYSVLDSSGAKTLGSSLTNHSIEILPGDYIVTLHDVHRAVRVGSRRTALDTGTITLRGRGKDLYSVRDSDAHTLVSSLTNGSVELFPGAYVVTLHDISVPASVQAGRGTVLTAGSVIVRGTGSTLYSVLDSAHTRTLVSSLTDGAVEMLPGQYVISLNQTVRNVQVAGGQETVVDR